VVVLVVALYLFVPIFTFVFLGKEKEKSTLIVWQIKQLPNYAEFPSKINSSLLGMEVLFRVLGSLLDHIKILI
jgi:hypothetical protein